MGLEGDSALVLVKISLAVKFIIVSSFGRAKTKIVVRLQFCRAELEKCGQATIFKDQGYVKFQDLKLSTKLSLRTT